jgi:hypothetical protein
MTSRTTDSSLPERRASQKAVATVTAIITAMKKITAPCL